VLIGNIFLFQVLSHFEFTPAFAMIFVAIFGATMTPYEFFWQASEEAEENVAKHKIKDISREDNSPRISRKEVRLMRTSR